MLLDFIRPQASACWLPVAPSVAGARPGRPQPGVVAGALRARRAVRLGRAHRAPGVREGAGQDHHRREPRWRPGGSLGAGPQA